MCPLKQIRVGWLFIPFFTGRITAANRQRKALGPMMSGRAGFRPKAYALPGMPDHAIGPGGAA
ncbi:MAG TPA: hypothetical protein DCR93_02735 [Cytophagales bacterium]|nr:hypothetical protein [Cytophagales bacterium]HAP58459.1 hypothetical protein [Cytophagales bacterium]